MSDNCSVLGEPLIDYVDHFQRRVIQDAVAEATVAYWHHRADEFDQALPRADDYTGHAAEAAVDAQRERIAATVEACRHRAEIALLAGEQDVEP